MMTNEQPTSKTINGKVYTVDSIRMMLATNDKAVERALVRLYEKQTAFEQSSEATINKNYQGFQPCDARMFSSFAKWILKGRSLTQKQLAYARRPWRSSRGNTKPAICKYARQIFNMMEAKA